MKKEESINKKENNTESAQYYGTAETTNNNNSFSIENVEESEWKDTTSESEYDENGFKTAWQSEDTEGIEIKDSIYHLVRTENNWNVLFGRYLMLKNATKKEAVKYVKELDMKKVLQLIVTMQKEFERAQQEELEKIIQQQKNDQ